MFTSFQEYAERLRPALNAAFSEHLNRLLGDSGLPRSCGGILTEGKKIRGSLLCLIATTLGGALEDALPRAVAVELIQTATLIHDDFVDQHRVRRNAPSLWTLAGARKAVLLGDIVFASAIHMMSELGRAEGGIVSGAIAEVSRGAYEEPLNPAAFLHEIEAERVDGTLYEKIIYLKTGVLFGAACQLGAVAAGADEVLQHAWRSYGLRIGEAYQIADDLHDVERALSTRTMTAGEVAALAPALLFFVRESRPLLVEALRRKSWRLTGESREQFRTAAELMRAEKERRLRAAAAAIAGEVADNGRNRLTDTIPWDLLRMFDEAQPQVFSP
jgi:geranylgeranyl pyrophosphate synthase